MDKLGIHKTTVCRWCDRYLSGGPEALEDRLPRPSRVWNRIPQPVRKKIKDLARKEWLNRIWLCLSAPMSFFKWMPRQSVTDSLHYC